MADTQAESGGYDYNWVEDPPDELNCLICLCVARDPLQHPGDSENECGRVFCCSCIHETKQEQCPNCREYLNLFKDSKSARQIRALKLKCDNLDNGCQWEGELRCLEEHLQTCEYTLLPCPNKCKDDDDANDLLRKDLQDHLTNKCPRRQFECLHCKEAGEYQERTTTHLETCPEIAVPCRNLGCEGTAPRRLIREHRSVCDYERVRCKYSEVGCEEKPQRKDLKEHEQDLQIHLKNAMDAVLELKMENKRRREMSSQIVKLTNFDKHLTTNNKFYSSSFYTSPNGYKMHMTVYANGSGGGKGTHVSVFTHLMKGDNDNSLTWPFTGTVTFKLLNQLEDNNHYKMTIRFQADNEYGKRVVAGKAGKGWGFPRFISHADLEYDPEDNCQYLKDNMLVFRITAEAPDFKPWLENAY